MELSVFFLLDQYHGIHADAKSVYQQVAAQTVLAEQLGYSAVFVAEHHIKPYGILPNPAQLLTWLAAKTSRIKLASAIAILPLHSPLRLAEEFALLDNLSNGRAILGVGSGFLDYEFAAFGQAAENKRELFDHALPAVEALLAGETIELSAKHLHSGSNVALNINSIQQPLPLFVAAVNPDAAFHIAKAGRNLLSVPFNQFTAAEDSLARFVNEFNRGNELFAQPRQHIVNVFCHVADSDAAAREAIGEAFGRYVSSRHGKEQSREDYLAIYDAWWKKGFIFSGSVDTVATRFYQLQQLGVKHVLTFQQFGAACHDAVVDSMTKMMTIKEQLS